MATEPTTNPTSPLLEIPPTAQREVAIEVRGLEKSFRVPTQRLDTLKERATRPFSRAEYRRLEAVQDMSFEVERGEFFGIVGRNGSGKSTLLKLLASIYRPDRGRIRVAGRLAPFIELGVGFNPELNAYENVVLNGVLMGLSPREARARFEDVIGFAELNEFAEMKLKNYSSGMLVRLGFSLMTQVDADIVLVDEVLAVGDAAFQQKCFDAFAQMHSQGRTIVLVTHDMVAVESHCTRAILLESGRLEESGSPGDVARRYLELNFERQRAEAAPEDVRIDDGAGVVRFGDVWIEDADGNRTNNLERGEPIRIRAEAEATGHLDEPIFGVQIVNVDGLPISAPEPFGLSGDRPKLEPGDRVTVEVTIDNRLASGHYFIHCAVGHYAPEPRMIAFRKQAVDFIVFGTGPFTGLVTLDSETEARLETGSAEEGSS